MLKLTLIAFGGALGSIGRYYLSSSFLKNFIILDIPIAILFINILGSFFFGVFMGILQNNILISSNIKIFVVTGFLAAFTTFSTFAWESIILFENQMYLKLAIYCLASVLLSIGFCLIGYYLGK